MKTYAVRLKRKGQIRTLVGKYDQAGARQAVELLMQTYNAVEVYREINDDLVVYDVEEQ